MRGRRDLQASMLAFVDLEERVPKGDPIRTIKVVADEALERLSPEFHRMRCGQETGPKSKVVEDTRPSYTLCELGCLLGSDRWSKFRIPQRHSSSP